MQQVQKSVSGVDGEGTTTMPGVKIPLEKGDMERDPNADYPRAVAFEHDMCDPFLSVWIRRAVHAKAFALAMEAEVERLREQLKHIGSHT